MAKCNLTNLCGIGVQDNLKLPRSGAVQAPFVIVYIKGKEDSNEARAIANTAGNATGFGVGNSSYPASVKSLQVGSSNGTGCDIEIVDQEAGDFAEIFKKITRGGTASDFRVTIRWGWIDGDCSGALPQIDQAGTGDPTIPSSTSAENHFLLLNMTVNYTIGGTVKYTLNCVDWVQTLYDSSSGKSFEKMTLKNAIKALLRQNNLEVEFVKFDGSSTVGVFKFETKSDGSVNADEGPIKDWLPMKRNVLETIHEWLAPYVSGDGKDGKGLRIFYESTTIPPKLICMVTTAPTCEQVVSKRYNVATYLVNAGNCLDGATLVLTEDGWKGIGNIVKWEYGGNILSFDGKYFVWNKITNWIRSPRAGRKMFKVHLNNSRQRFNSTSGGIFTEDHPILTKRGYVEVKDLKSEDKINSGYNHPTSILRQVAIGTLLGDASISTKSNYMEITHSLSQESYLRHKGLLLGLKNIKYKNNKSKKGGKPYACIRASGKASPYWRKLCKLFYTNGRKTITKDALEDFGIISLAYLYMDDGHLIEEKGLASIATCCFERDEVLILMDKIKELGIESYMRPNDKYHRLYFDKSNTNKLSLAISSYIHEDLLYKLLPEHRANQKNNLKFEEEPFYDSFEVVRWEKSDKAKTVYCLEVEGTNNFITHSGVVHNCSPVLNFQTNIKYNGLTTFAASGAVPGNTAGAQQMKGPSPCIANPTQLPNLYDPNAVLQVGLAIAPSLTRWEVLSRMGAALELRMKGIMLHNLANNYVAPIEADLRIVGDPTYSRPFLFIGRYVTLVVINPYQVATGCVWTNTSGLSKTSCNEVLTHTEWMIDGVFHDIKDGSYTTTLKLRLVAPGQEIGFFRPPGGANP